MGPVCFTTAEDYRVLRVVARLQAFVCQSTCPPPAARIAIAARFATLLTAEKSTLVLSSKPINERDRLQRCPGVAAPAVE